MQLNVQGIANLLSVPMFEGMGCIVTTYTKNIWVLFTSQGKHHVFKIDTGVFNRMSCIELHTKREGMAMIKPIRNNFESYTKKEIGKARLSCAVQSTIGHPPKEYYK